MKEMKKMKKSRSHLGIDWSEVIMGSVAFVLILSIIGAIIWSWVDGAKMDKKDEEFFNNGIHAECGGTWVYEQAVGHSSDTDYIFICDKCGIRHEFEKNEY